MATNPTIKQATELMNYYTQVHRQHSSAPPMFNRAVEKWAARELIESFGLEKCMEAVDWYFKVNKRPDWKGYVRSCGDCITESGLVHADTEKRRSNRAVALEWRNS